MPRVRGSCARGPRALQAACVAGSGNRVRVLVASRRGGSGSERGAPPCLSPAALPEPCSPRTTSHRARRPRRPRALTPRGRLGWQGRDPGRRPWKALSSPWTRKSKAVPRPARCPLSDCSPRRLRTCVCQPQGVCAAQAAALVRVAGVPGRSLWHPSSFHQDRAPSFTLFQEVTVRNPGPGARVVLVRVSQTPLPEARRPVPLTSGLQRP